MKAKKLLKTINSSDKVVICQGESLIYAGFLRELSFGDYRVISEQQVAETSAEACKYMDVLPEWLRDSLFILIAIQYHHWSLVGLNMSR